MKRFVRQYQNLGGSWSVVWEYTWLGKKYYIRTIEYRKFEIEKKFPFI